MILRQAHAELSRPLVHALPFRLTVIILIGRHLAGVSFNTFLQFSGTGNVCAPLFFPRSWPS